MNYSLFKKEQIEDIDLAGLSKFTCQSCGLYKDVITEKMPPYGDFRLKILNVGEAPGQTEDERGKPWQGKAGLRLQHEYQKLGVDLFEDCLNVNSANCRPPRNRAPTNNEIACCRVQVVNPTLKKYAPHTIILLGGIAIESIIGQHWKKDLGAVSKWRGLTIPDQTLKAWLCPVYHPSYIEREQARDEVATIWRQDLERAIDTIHKKLPIFGDPRDQVVLLRGDDDITTILERIARGEEGDLVAFDYETSGLKPQAEGHRIVCASVATEEHTYAFMMSDGIARAWCRFLKSEIRKVAHNLKFEDTWSKVIFGVDVQNWFWDTMLAAHVLDNRRGITSLKFQTYMCFGVAGYDATIEPYLESSEKKASGNSFNRIEQAITDLGENEVLAYCGLDSLFTKLLAVKQIGAIV
jgi:uracil-DNA glycosylase family 4